MFWKPGLTQGAPTGWRSRDRSGAQGQCGSQRAGHYRCWKSPPPFKSMWPEACWGEGDVGDAPGTKEGMNLRAGRGRRAVCTDGQAGGSLASAAVGQYAPTDRRAQSGGMPVKAAIGRNAQTGLLWQ